MSARRKARRQPAPRRPALQIVKSSPAANRDRCLTDCTVGDWLHVGRNTWLSVTRVLHGSFVVAQDVATGARTAWMADYWDDDGDVVHTRIAWPNKLPRQPMIAWRFKA